MLKKLGNIGNLFLLALHSCSLSLLVNTSRVKFAFGFFSGFDRNYKTVSECEMMSQQEQAISEKL